MPGLHEDLDSVPGTAETCMVNKSVILVVEKGHGEGGSRSHSATSEVEARLTDTIHRQNTVYITNKS